MIDLTVPRRWTIVLSGEFSVPGGGTRRAVVITEPDGGNVRLKRARNIRWTNQSGRPVLLRFQEWPEEGGGDAEAVWPFNAYEGGIDVAPQMGAAIIPANESSGTGWKCRIVLADQSGLSPFERLLTLLTRERPGEGRSAFLILSCTAFPLLFSYEVLKALREAFLLMKFSAELRRAVPTWRLQRVAHLAR